MPPLTNANNKEEIKQALDEITVYVDEEDQSLSERRKNRFVGWVISGMTHALFILVFGFIVYAQVEDSNDELPPIKIALIDTPKQETPKERDLVPRDTVIEIETKEPTIENPVITKIDLPIDEHNTESETNANDVAKGREEAISDSEMGAQGVFTAIGTGGGSSGLLGSRTGLGKVRARGALGSQGRAVDGGIDAGLRWLKKHQSPNGSWDAVNYTKNCDENPKCEPGNSQAGDANVALTGYAVLCFLGAGYDHKTPNKFSKVVEKGLEYLVSVQNKEGLMGERNYEHAVATMALAEAYAMTNDPVLKVPAQNSVNVVLSRQSKGKSNYGLAWDYVNPNDSRLDTSVTGWNVMALKSALAGGLQVRDGMVGAKEWLEKAYKAANPDWKKFDPYSSKAVFPYVWDSISDKVEKEHLSFVGAVCAVFLGHHQGDIMLETLCNDMESRWVDNGAYKNNNYASYYIVMAEFQSGGNRWKKCLDTIIPHLIQVQRKEEGCFDGSWDYTGQQWHGSDTGRVLSTCYSLLNLEVAYRYVKVK
jgi:hypothetical protein